MRKYCFVELVFVFCLTGILLSCNDYSSDSLERQDLFSLSYGNFEDQLNFFTAENSYFGYDAHIFMKDGLMYISNSGGQKLLKTSSYGDLLSVYYNAATNPQPTFITENSGEDTASTRKAVEYPFNYCTFLTVSNEKHLYVVDTVPNERVEFDHDENIALKNVILHFGDDGQFIDYIGQEGIGGTPFPNVSAIHSNSNNDIIVVCKTQKAMKVFWYTGSGELMYKIPIMFDSLPSSYDATVNVATSVDKVLPAYNKKEIYIKIDYYVDMIDPETGARIGNNYDKSCVYRLDLDTAKYKHVRDIEPFISSETDQNGAVMEIPRIYSLMGITVSNWCFLSVTQNSGYALLLLNLDDGKKYDFNLEVEPEKTIYNSFHVTYDGRLVAFLADNEKATISVWHTENIIRR